MRDMLISADLLAWYDVHARELPWRVGPKEDRLPDPYRVWLSEIMLQQTTVAAVKAYFAKFTETWPTVQDLAAAEDADVMAAWAGLGYYARARNLLKCARVVAGELNGAFPDNREGLQKLPGIGPYTSAAIASIAFGQRETVVDGNVERVMARLYAEETPLPTSKPLLRDYAEAQTPKNRAGDYAQAVMDLGATVCTPKSPACGICPIRSHCNAQSQGIERELPKKLPKAAKPVRRGIAYVVRREDGAVLLETRPEKGLLGGMLGWPGTDWAETEPVSEPPIDADWITLNEEVRHAFTHFHLRLTVHVAEVRQDARAFRGGFVDPSDFRANDLPTVMRKVHALSSSS
ncbi:MULTISPECIES: A/G-specific adenine glycosylase [Halocynthiibacter]|uniref:Adenine DNA glycosylase n=1 Tax=Halocynthiibacter halioticoli TaxID=2986804 RepID=A0AAE3J2R3_9RHOB|nr:MULTISPECIES: A/G-specific adenine glycosylase [Halocynthiibacter]MCV6825683.1 A/G-specific adenine glycosylase [Halocynthiibacter halioticoli]MCW4058684.1 A/G-specific adenine glycosylase [Halocynthiibacter sp. SDUM655004]